VSFFLSLWVQEFKDKIKIKIKSQDPNPELTPQEHHPGENSKHENNFDIFRKKNENLRILNKIIKKLYNFGKKIKN